MNYNNTTKRGMTNSLKVERVINRMTQAELAEKVGVSRQTIHAIETGKFTPATDLAMQIAEALGKTVEQIFTLNKA